MANAEGLSITRNSRLEDSDKADLFGVKFTGLYSNEQGGTHDMRTIPTEDDDGSEGEEFPEPLYSLGFSNSAGWMILKKNVKGGKDGLVVVREEYLVVDSPAKGHRLVQLLNDADW